ncbi:MAG: T9SS type A sorting domain-containing protein [FCB group bacterium]|nr:T9SS type A sorting domain-containing protein [FCB group bacterium]
MLKQLIIIISIVLLPVSGYAQAPDTLWTRTYGGGASDLGFGVQQTDDGGFIIIGKTNSNSAGMSDIYLIKTDANGDTLWTRKYGGEFTDSGRFVLQNEDGGYILVCMFGLTSSNVCLQLIKTDQNGDTLWTRTHAAHQVYQSIRQTEDGGYIIAGSAQEDAAMIKTNADGEIEWAQTYNGNEWDYGSCAVPISDGGYILTGSITQSYPGQTNVFLIKTDADGDTVWTRSIGENMVDSGSCVIEDSNGDYVVTGMLNGEDEADIYSDVYLVKVDVNGDTLWTNFYGRRYNDWGNYLVQASDGGYVMTGFCDYAWSTPYEGDLTLVKADFDGDEEWYLTFGGADMDNGKCVQKTVDGGYIVVGHTYSYGAGSADIWLLRFEGELATTEDSDYSSPGEFELYPPFPNPFNSQTVISYEIRDAGFVELKAYDVTGREAARLVDSMKPAGQHQVVFDASELPSGVYICRMTVGSFSRTQKILLIK